MGQTPYLYHVSYACQLLGRTMAVDLLWGIPYIWVQVPFFTCRILYDGELNFTHLLGFEGAIGSAL
jgi:hypothetical protein